MCCQRIQMKATSESISIKSCRAVVQVWQQLNRLLQWLMAMADIISKLKPKELIRTTLCLPQADGSYSLVGPGFLPVTVIRPLPMIHCVTALIRELTNREYCSACLKPTEPVRKTHTLVSRTISHVLPTKL